MSNSALAPLAADIGRIRRRAARRGGLATAGLALTALTIAALAMVLGDFPIAAGEMLVSFASPFTGRASPGIDFIVLEVRLPRVLVALTAGAAFGLSGVIFQTLLRNPLASPDVIGISGGAGAGAVVAMVALGWSGPVVSLSAFAGALAAALAIHVLVWRRGIDPYRMVLVGIGLAALCQGLVGYLFIQARIMTVQKALVWLTGSLNNVTGSELVPLALACLLLIPAALLLSRTLSALTLGDEAARALGTRVEAGRLSLIVVAVGLVAAATAAVGPLLFVAMVAGPIAHRLVRPSGGVLVAAALIGGIVTLAADLIAQHVLPSQLPAGVVTGAFGAVFLLGLLIVAQRGGRGG